ncbi:hypothetical protein PC129_g17752 [Phytophthora cactorum]|nr:hypothetical protein Pcac1_g11476 [Phytophthora cactorum]KAG2803778.1 hypothetical protein PC112_g19026 [Phytophthora cactorum]KAG2804689.1 hypothetical protein PC111_g18145 [Phytophthora cactorum]KAG2841439.1 hypothetical protein PC113_g19037 [Phytophthora cactorum]KAG2893371.1 hypothetical protein PC115_g18491 [Phytophthora cactorum]
MLIAQAGRLAERHLIPSRCLPRFGTSWLCRFQERYGIKWKRPHGESGSVDLQAAATEMQRLRNLIGSYPYANVFNMDETGLFYNAVPRGSLWVNESPSLKQDKARITLAVCTNVKGSDKLPLLFIGNSVKPRWIQDKPAAIQYKLIKVLGSWKRGLG